MSVLCLRCGYSITEPICASCIIDEIKVWFYEQKVKKEIVRRINGKLKILSREIEEMDYVLSPTQNVWGGVKMRCIKCEQEMHLMCAYCVTNESSKIVKWNLTDENTIESFNESFNSEIYDCGLKREEVDNQLFEEREIENT